VKRTAAAASALALGALTTPAHADEPATPDHDWSGFYVGATAGMGSANVDWDIDGGEGLFVDEDGSADGSESPGTGSIHFGYNDQVGSIVVGGEVDYSLANFKEEIHFDGGYGAALTTKMHGFGSVRGRVGYAAGNVLCYATGGIAVGDLKQKHNSDGPLATETTSTAVGWIAGGGVEVAISEKISLLAEGVYSTFYDDGTASGPFYSDEFQVETSLAIGRVGLNYRF
jgi:outer membrane immunogenic protein